MSAPVKILNKVLSKYSSPMTLKYPSNVEPSKKYSQIPEKLRGFPERDKEKCIGCRACYMVCSGRATKIFDTADKRKVQIFLFRCTYCAHCEESCPEEAIKMTPRFELTCTSREDQAAYVDTELEMNVCQGCGKAYLPKKMVKRVSERLSDKINPQVKETVLADYQKLSNFCPDCRRMRSVDMDTHTKKYVWMEGQ